MNNIEYNVVNFRNLCYDTLKFFKKMLKKLLNLGLFADISEQELAAVFSAVNYRLKNIKKKAYILRQDEEYKSLHIILKGNCYGEMLDFSGKAIKIEDLPAPVPLAPAVLFSRQNKMPVSIIADTDCEILIITRDEFIRACIENKKILYNFLELISDKFVFISEKLNFLQFKSIKEKILNYLLSLPQDKNGNRILPCSLEQLSRLFGIERPSLSRALGQMEAANIIKRKNRDIRIVMEQN